MPQMTANGQMMLQQQQQQQQQQQPQQPSSKALNQIVYSNLVQSMNLAPVNSWQRGVHITDRFAPTMNLYASDPPGVHLHHPMDF